MKYRINHEDTREGRNQFGYLLLESFKMGTVELIPQPECFIIDEFNLIKAKLIYGKLIDELIFTPMISDEDEN